MPRSFAGMRRSLRRLMDKQVDIQTRTVSSDASGGPTETWSTRESGVRCNIQPMAADEILKFRRDNVEVTHRCFLDLDWSINPETERFVISGTTRIINLRGKIEFDEVGVLWKVLGQEES